MQGSAENRRSARETLRVPVKLEVIQASDCTTKIFLAYISNVSTHGLSLSLPARTVLNFDAEILIYIDGCSLYKTTRLSAKVLWQKDSQCGLQLLSRHDSIRNILRKAALLFEIKAG